MPDDSSGWPALLTTAAGRAGVVTIRDARRHGVADSSFHDRAHRDGWSRLGAGCWLVAGCPPTTLTTHVAALEAFPAGLVSHDTALELLGLRDQPSYESRIHVVVPYATTASPPRGVIRHRSRELDERDRVIVSGLRVTTAARSILDTAPTLPRWRIEGLLLAARQRRLLTMEHVQDQLRRRPTVRGAAVVRDALATVDGSDADSILEARCRKVLADDGMPVSSGPVSVSTSGGTLAVDLVVGHHVAVECDGYAFHSSVPAFERDRERWRLLREAGWTIVWVTWRRLHDRPHDVVAEVRRALASID